jgi:hypothetical protein
MGFLGGAFINFKVKVMKILNFESMLSLEIHLNFILFYSQLSFIVKIMFTLGIIVIFTFGLMAHAILVYLLSKVVS